MFVAKTWPACEKLIGQPISVVIVEAMSAERFCSAASRRSSTSARSAGALRGHGPRSNASRAIATARSTSASRASGTRPMRSSVNGEQTSMTALLEGFWWFPPMYNVS